MSGANRNQPCWCGSGIKFKNCHMGRDQQERPSIWNLGADFRKLHTAKACLHPDASPATCSGGIVRAHTVRRSADLKTIARNGHVYQANADPSVLQKTGGRIVPQLIGIKEASTFWGFCQTHDTVTFAPLETQPIIPTEEQAFLLAYRPLAKELYLKERQLETMDLARRADKGRQLADQIAIQQMIWMMETGIRAAIRDVRHHKRTFDQDLLSRDFSEVRFVVFHLDRAPDIMCSGVVQPQHTFDGKAIQDIGDITSTLEFLSFSLFATGLGGAAAFVWRSDSDTASSALVNSLLALPQDEIPHALVRFAFSGFENTFYNPDWWESLSPKVQQALTARVYHGASPELEMQSDHLCDDGIRSVNWSISRVEQKRACT